ncbi:MAG TPA: TolC family protein [Planctomycetaceae bacterium]|nr:TolC family protein [Planctomycetaceae bacterium]HQZ69045.1 TolC family protein [Planctomycetaceae bacterium]
MLRQPVETTTIRGQDADTGYDRSMQPLSIPWNHNQAAPPNQGPDVYLPLTLRDAIEAALYDSSVVRVLDGGVNVAAITPTDVLIAEQQIAVEQGRFQPKLAANYDGSRINEPPNAFFGPGIAANTRRDSVNAFARVTQPFSTGGSLSMGLEPPTAYLYLPNGVDPGEFNPLYSTDYVLRVNQPLLRNRGRAVTLAPIRISQLQANQSRWELEEVLNSQIRSLIEGYWRLYSAHLQLQAVKSILPVAEESVRVEQLRLEADRSILADVARARFQLDGFRRSKSTMEGALRTRVLQLRQLMNGEPNVQPLFLPSEKPSETPPPEDVSTLVQVALENRPTLNRLRERLNQRNVELAVARNQVLPVMDFRGEYRMDGLTDSLDASFRQAATAQYTDWTLGVGVEIPIGNKTNLSRRQIAEFAVARDHLRLRATEQNVSFEIVQLVSNLKMQWQKLQIAKQQAQETQEWLRVSRIRYTQPPASSASQDWLLLALTDLQSAMRAYVDAIGNVGDAMADYSTTLAELNQAQGISVYQWRQDSVQEVPGGHAGLWIHDYRTAPGQTIQILSAPPQTEVFQLPDGISAPSTGISGGHSFLPDPMAAPTVPPVETARPLFPQD